MDQQNISTLIKDIQNLFKGKTPLEYLDEFKINLSDIVSTRFARYLKEREPKLTLSMIGKPLRRIWYELKGYKSEEIKPEDLFKFLYGDLLESLLIFLIRESGHSVSLFQERVELDSVTGKIDCIIDNYLIDIKSCSDNSFRKFINRDIVKSDDLGYLGQLSGYTSSLLDLGYPLQGSGFLAINKSNGKLCLCLFSLKEILELGKPRDKIRTIRESLKSDNPPERCYKPVLLYKKDKNSPLILGRECSYCPFKYFCWSDVNGGKGLKVLEYAVEDKYLVNDKGKSFRVKVSTQDEFPVREDDN